MSAALFHAAEVLRACRARLAQGSPEQGFTGVSTDTRSLRPGDLFVALRGERFDGHQFLAAAAAAGAAGALVDAAGLAALPPALRAVGGPALLVVGDTLAGLQDLAAWHRSRLSPTVVGVTGSNGKTTSKALIAAALARFGPVHATSGNLNNHIGVPLTLLGLRPEHRYAVIEMGTSGPGEIALLARLAAPHCGLITCLAAAHTAGLGGLEGVARAKGELFEALPAEGFAAYLAEEPLLEAAAQRGPQRRVRFGRDPRADLRLVAERASAGPGQGAAGTIRLAGGDHDLRLGLLGRHNLLNAAAALAVVQGLGLPLEPALAAFATVAPAPHRMQPLEVAGLRVVDDAYNANLGSMLAALDALAELRRELGAGPRWAVVLGEMLELGALSEAAHAAAGRRAAELGVDFLITVGQQAAVAGDAARAAGLEASQHVAAAAEVAALLAPWARRGDLVLLKGSRGVGLERVLRDLALVGEGA